MQKILSLSLWLTLFITTVMWLSSYTHYTSIGIDADRLQQDKISHHYFRIRWPGNGSIWLGGGKTQRASDPSKPYEPFDLAATFFYVNPEKPQIKTILNRWGFWYQNINKPNQQLWLGIPSWLPVLFIFLFLIKIKQKRRNKSVLKH